MPAVPIETIRARCHIFEADQSPIDVRGGLWKGPLIACPCGQSFRVYPPFYAGVEIVACPACFETHTVTFTGEMSPAERAEWDAIDHWLRTGEEANEPCMSPGCKNTAAWSQPFCTPACGLRREMELAPEIEALLQ